MNFENLSEMVRMHQYEEVKIIGRDVCTHGKNYHFAAMVRNGDVMQVYVLELVEPRRRWNPEGDRTMRQQMKGTVSASTAFINQLKTGGQVLQGTTAQGSSLNQEDTQLLLFFAKLMDMGWKLPQDSPFGQADWSCVECCISSFQVPSEKLPEWENGCLSAVWGPQMQQHAIEKPVLLEIEDETAQPRSHAKELAFSISDDSGRLQEGVCYINSVRRVDVWKQDEKRYADPEYKKRVLEYMTPEAFEDMKKQSARILEQSCPRGMYFLCVEYECTLDYNLQFYASDYLESAPEHKASASAIMFHAKPESDKGMHGLELKAAIIQMPVSADETQIWAELFQAYKVVPEREEVLPF